MADGSPFWNFSLKFYRDKNVSAACIKLQDQHGIDVNVMLFGMWLASQGRALSRENMHEIMDSSETWRIQVVVPLRSVRRILRQPADAAGKGSKAFDHDAAAQLRERVKAVELEAERLQQEALFALKPASGWGEARDAAAAAAQNLDVYAKAMRAQFDPAASRALLEAFGQMN